jgi:tetratricopeptide (TPR) repeat protein
VDPIIRICSLLAFAALLTPSVAQAKREAPSALGRYVEARVADTAGQSLQAVTSYGAALTADPASQPIALRAYRRAVVSGDKALALRAARALEGMNALPVDARLLLLSEAINRSDWRGGQMQIDRIEEGGTFAFLTPVLRAWLMLGAGQGDPLGALVKPSADGLSNAYAQEHRGLILLAMKQVEPGIAGVNAVRSAGLTDGRNLQLRLIAAARLVELKNKGAALSMLAGDETVLILARAEVEAGRPLLGSVVRPNSGVAMLLARVSNDLIRDNASPVAVTLARLGQFADPAYLPGQLVLARALAANRDYDASLAVLDRLKGSKVADSLSTDLRFDVQLNAGRFEPALQLAEALAAERDATPYDHSRLGEILSRMDRHAEAATAYARAIEVMAGPKRDAAVPWNLWLLLGREFDAAKDWKRAKPALERAAALGPKEASALNHLGYAMLVNGESVDVATQLIERASALRPNDAAITDSLGWALVKGGKADRAIPVLERAAESEPTISEISDHLGDAYWAVGRKIDARYAWRAALVQAEPGDSKRLLTKIDFGPSGAK